MIFEFLKAAMPTPLRNPDKYEIFSFYADIYRLLELSGDADNLTRTFFFLYSLGSAEIPLSLDLQFGHVTTRWR